MKDLHDSVIYGYAVDGKSRRIVLHTEYLERGGGSGNVVERNDVVFEGVEAYSFSPGSLESVIFSINERSLEAGLAAHESEIEEASRWTGIPFWHRDAEKRRSAVQGLGQKGVRWFDLDSSYGMHGWVVALAVSVVSRRIDTGHDAVSST